MDHREAGRYWNDNAEAWTVLVRKGYDVYRDRLNTPAFLEMLPDVRGLRGLDIGCGEGHNTRLVAQRGAAMTALDVSEVSVGHAREAERDVPLGITFVVASAVELPFPDEAFDFATGFMSFDTIPETDRVLAETHRVLRPGGFLQFSICHPCFDPPHRRNLRGADGRTYAFEVGDYFRRLDGEVSEWTFGSAPACATEGLRPFRTPLFHRTLSEWMNLLVGAGFAIEHLLEPRPDDEAVRECPYIQGAQVVAYFLHVRARKARSHE
jgi:SAM-dependent methyltransferase